MRSQLQQDALGALQHFDRSLCLKWNAIKSVPLLRFFIAVSRLGDGFVWVGLGLMLPLMFGPEAWPVVGRLTLAAPVCFVVYRGIKLKLARPRPCASDIGVVAWTGPLDVYAFPSGHTLHAVAFGLILIRAFPQLFWLIGPLIGLIGISRVVLGLHYPSDVAAGALIGALVGWTFSIGLP